MVGDFLKWSGEYNANPSYEAVISNVLPGWGAMILMIVIFAAVSVIVLNSIDKDKR